MSLQDPDRNGQRSRRASSSSNRMSPTSPLFSPSAALRTSPLNSPRLPSIPDDDSDSNANGNSTSNSNSSGNAELAWLRPYISEKAYTFVSSNLGLVYVACAQFFFACMNITVKYFLSRTSISVTTLIFTRMGITALCCIIALQVINDPNPIFGPPEIRRWLVYRGLSGMVGLFSAYKSYTGLTVSDSMSIQFLTPTLTSIFGFLLLGEMCSVKEVLAGLASLGGVILISRPPMLFGGIDDGEGIPPDDSVPGGHNPNSSTRMAGVLWALLSVCGSTAAYLTIRKIGKRAHALHSISYFSYMCTIVTFFITLFTIRSTTWPETLRELFFILLIGFFGFIAQMLLTLGLQRERVGRAGIALYLSVFYAIVLELLVFQTLPAFLSFCGIAVILSSAYWVAKSKQEQKPVVRDEIDDMESQPISRTPSPALLPGKIGRSVSYSSVMIDTEDDQVRLLSPGHDRNLKPQRERGAMSDSSKRSDRARR